jgi:hypothetical protein
MWVRSIRLAFILMCATTLQIAAATVNAETWNVSLSTTGDDVFWTSPTTVATGYSAYDWSYEITKVNVKTILGNPSVLDLLETTSGSGTAGSLPIQVVDDTLSEPTTNSSADIFIEIGADGFGHASGTNITLGRFGIFEIQGVDFEATISVIGIPTGDYNRDGEVDAADYEKWRDDFGSTTDLAADGSGNQVVDAADYTVWRDNLDSGEEAQASLAVPEPAAICLALGGIVVGIVFAGRFGAKKSRIS